MKFIERLLVMCCVTGIAMHLFLKDNPFAIEWIALVATAGFYLLFTFFVVQDGPVFKRETYAGTQWPEVVVAVANGIIYAYCALFIWQVNLYSVPVFDMVENCGLLLVLLSVGTYLLLRKKRKPIYKQLLIRDILFLSAIGIDALLRIYLLPNPQFFRR